MEDHSHQIDILTVHDSELQAAVLDGKEAKVRLADVTGYERRADGLFDELRCTGELRIRGVKEFSSTGSWYDEFVLSATIDGVEISTYAQVATTGVEATSLVFEFIGARITISCEGLVHFNPNGNIEVLRRGIDPFA